MAGEFVLDNLTLKQLEGEVTCGICQEYYTDPKILPCLHYYCKQCVLKLALRTGLDKPFYCPECRSEVTLPKEGVEGLKSAFFVNRFKSTFTTLQHSHGKVEVKCEACSGDRAESFCRQCAMFICQTCADSHLGQKSHYANHEVVSLQDLKEGKAKAPATKLEPSLQKCPDHNEDMKIFCYDCNIIICRDCTVVDHKDHRFQFCKIAAPVVIEDLIKELEPLKKTGEQLVLAIKDVKFTKEDVKDQGIGVATTINHFFDEQIEMIDHQRKELLKEAQGRVQEKVEKLITQENALSLVNAEIQSVVDYTEKCLSHSSDNEVLELQNGIKKKIIQKTGEFKPNQSIKPVQEADLGVELHCTDTFKMKSKFFQIPVNFFQCTVEGEGIVMAEVGKEACFTLHGKKSKHSATVSSELKCIHDDSVVQCAVDQSGPGQYLIQYTPTVRGRHALTVSVDGRHIVGSPFPVFVSIHPSQLGVPVEVWNGLERPTGLAINLRGELMVGKQKGDAIVRIISSSTYNHLSRKSLELDSYHIVGVVMDNEDFVYLTLFNSNSLYKVTVEGSIVTRVQAVECEGHLGVALVKAEVMVCPRPTKGTIMVYTRELKYVRMITGSDMGQLHDISSDSLGNLYVTDSGKNCIQVFSNHGDFLQTFGSGTNKREALTCPLELCVDKQHVYVCNNGQATRNHSIYVFTTKGVFVTKFGEKGEKNGDFNIPHSLCINQDGFIYVSDRRNNRIQKF